MGARTKKERSRRNKERKAYWAAKAELSKPGTGLTVAKLKAAFNILTSNY